MRRTAVVTLLGLLSLAGCKPGNVVVSGNVTYRERMALPPNAIVRISIEDVSLADTGPHLVASTVVPTAGHQVPIAYTITLADPKQIDPKHQYALRARIEDGHGELLFVNDTRYGVITNGVFRQDVIVKRVAAP